MVVSLLPLIFLICILSTTVSITNFTHAYKLCRDDQKALLLELKKELIFDPYVSSKLIHWNQTRHCCIWKGVECDGAGHVISLQLDDEAISGGLETSSSLFSLRYLEKLNLAYNNFNHTRIPARILNLTYLSHLNLSYAGFSGQVPLELSEMRRLVSLDISNRYWAPQPLKLEYPNLKMLLQSLRGLRELYLDGANISAHGNEWCHIISSFVPNLTKLSLRYCDLSGPLDPSLSKLHSLSVLQLDGNNLSATIPNFLSNFSNLTTLSLSDCSLKGFIPKMIFWVPTLQNLDLSHNMLLGGTIPEISLSESFRFIDLSGCAFSGPIPSMLASLTELTYVDFGYNNLSGTLSSTNFEGLSNLVYMNLEHNSISGSIPHSLFGLHSLQTLRLSNNQFSGQVNGFPALNLSNMIVLDLSSNRLQGTIPESIFQLESLAELSLSYNSFTGTFQLEKIQRLHNLNILDLSYNKLTVDAVSSNSSFPRLSSLSLASCNLINFPDLRNQSNVDYLDLSNNRITGEIPAWIWEIGNGVSYIPLDVNLSLNLLTDVQKPYRIPSNIHVLDLHSNQLQGEFPLPPEGAYYVDYSSNNFDKPIPSNIGDFTSYLGFFSVANNGIIGEIPTSLCNRINYLQVLDLSVNKLSGTIPLCLLENIESLEVFKLGRNNISGIIPAKISVNCSLKSLDLSNNIFEGNIPEPIANCRSLEVMNVGNNNMADNFPCMLPSSLRVLVLRSNRFHGVVRCHKSWPNLQIIDISSNNFSGNLYPESFSSWRGMMLESDAQLGRNHSGFDFLHLTDFYYSDEVTLTIKGLELKLVKIWPDFTSVDFSLNKFHGEIPDVIGGLNSLYLLNLSHNALTGIIPKSFGNLRQLGSLDISMNQLIGTIPEELARLTFLQVLNLSYNKLVGRIPIGPQLQTFPEALFEGNIGLCGLPLNKSCSNTDENDLSRNVQSHRKTEIEWDYVSAALGYVVGLGSFAWLLLCNCRSLRTRYFEKIDEVFQKIFIRLDRRRRAHARTRVLRNQARRQ